MILLVDLDGTIAHFDREFDRLLNEHYSHLPNIPRSHEQVSFNLWDGRTEEEQEAIRQIMNFPGFYRHLEPMAGGVEAVKEMVDEGHEVHFVTAPWNSNRTCLQDKSDWVADHFGSEYRDRLIFAKDKTLVTGDILFDDKHPIPNKDRAVWTQVFVHQLYNQDADGYRLRDWSEWRRVVEQVRVERSASTLDRLIEA